MPITDTTIIDGPNTQSDGSRRGTVRLTFADGRVFQRRLVAVDATAWANLLLDIVSEQEAKVAKDDADAESRNDNEILAVKEASQEQVALAYLRRAYEIGDPYLAYLKFARFNDYRLSKGWSLNQVVAGLASVGLTETEWLDMKARHQYLSQSSRVTAMVAYLSVVDGDTWGAEFR